MRSSVKQATFNARTPHTHGVEFDVRLIHLPRRHYASVCPIPWTSAPPSPLNPSSSLIHPGIPPISMDSRVKREIL